MSPAPDMITLDGTVERIVFRNQDNDFTVARFAVEGADGPATAVGTLTGVLEGQPLRLRGTWIDDKRFGRQFKIDSYQTRSPETLLGIERFLGSGVINGIGPELARRLTAKFGLDTLRVVEEEPNRLIEVEGIGPHRAARLSHAFAEQRHLQDVMVFLRGHGVTAAFAARIVKTYGADAIRVVKTDPYRLALEVWGIGFRTADSIAEKIGIAKDDPKRLAAGIAHVLETQLEDGHCHVPEEQLTALASDLLGVPQERVKPSLSQLEHQQRVVKEVLGDRGACVSLLEIWQTERSAAIALAELARTPARPLTLDIDAAIKDFEVAHTIDLAPQQARAIAAALLDKITVITGGPGVGKTTIVRAIVHLATLLRRKVALAAPTGRAALRLSEATGREAITIHRLLEFQPQAGTFAKTSEDPLEADLVVADEASMIDIELFGAMVRAIPPSAQLVLVGDVDQLPSVGPGAVLGDVIASGAATVVRLTEVFRQAAKSRIVVSAHQINRGELPDLDPPAPPPASSGAPAPDAPATDFFFIARDDPEAARNTIVELVAERIPARFGLDAVRDVQVLAPMHRGDLGTSALNVALQQRLNAPRDGAVELARGERAFRVGDKVMQLRNDYDKGVYNGDLGVIVSIDDGGARLKLELTDGRTAEYERAELDQLVHAYAVSVHKSQGSEYAAVVIPVATQHFVMLQRSLLYTAVTRGKKLVVIVGSRKAVAMAVRNASARRRWTWLAERIRGELADR
jgi:exodeoxyribonuclease V alpha subunit